MHSSPMKKSRSSTPCTHQPLVIRAAQPPGGGGRLTRALRDGPLVSLTAMVEGKMYCGSVFPAKPSFV